MITRLRIGFTKAIFSAHMNGSTFHVSALLKDPSAIGCALNVDDPD